jgi:glycine C-acetyltransferase
MTETAFKAATSHKHSAIFDARADALSAQLKKDGLWKELQVISSPMDAKVRLRTPDGKSRDVLCFCSNNYLGLANHPEVIEAGERALRDFGAGTASVRFICGTFTPHLELERRIAEYMGTQASYTFVSAWTANEAVFPTLCEPGDTIISDELNHACIIDAIRLATTIKKGIHKAVYRNNVLEGEKSLRTALEAASLNRSESGKPGQIWVVTDGVFSMEGSIADLPKMRQLCDQFNAILVVDDSHGHGVMGTTGRGTHEHWGMIDEGEPSADALAGMSTLSAMLDKSLDKGRVDIFTGTLGKALGGGAGGFVAGPKKAIEILQREPQRVERLRSNVKYAREKLKNAGFDVLPSPTAICPIIVHDTAKAIAMSKRLLELGIYVIGFGYPVVAEGHARLRCQISAAHTTQHIDALVDALKKL